MDRSARWEARQRIDLSGNNSVDANILILGPGNGSDTLATATEVPMSETGTAKRLFVDVDDDPGTHMNIGLPSSFLFLPVQG